MDRSKLFNFSEGKKFQGKTTQEIFTQIMKDDFWEEGESVSGPGSTLAQTRELVRLLPLVFEKFAIKKILDAPCGDFNWMRKTDLSNIEYIGGDIVKRITDKNNQKYAAKNTSFLQMDLLSPIGGEFDLLFCRDCLVHLSYADIFKVLDNIKNGRIKYFMTTTFPEEPENKDIATGGWRPLNLILPPFGFPKPIYLLNEKCTEADGIFADKSMCLWEVDQLV